MRVAELTVRGKRALVKTKIFYGFQIKLIFFHFFILLYSHKMGLKIYKNIYIFQV